MDFDLKVIFKEHDNDNDGRLNADQVLSLLKQLGHNIYKGSIGKIIRLLNYKDPENKTLDFNQLKQYHDALQSKGKYNIWKSKYELWESSENIKKQTNAAPSQSSDKGQEGSIKITVGIPPPEYPSSLQIILQKAQKKESKPFIKIIIDCFSNQQAKKTQNLINQIYSSLIEIIKSEQPDFQKQIDTVKLITNVNFKTLLILITTSNEDLIQLGLVFSKYIDQSINRAITALFHFRFHFDFNFQKFLTDPSYTFYDLFTKNCSFNINWKGSQFISALKETLLMNNFFQDLVHDPMRPQILSVIAALSIEKCKADIQFQNTQYQNIQYQSKQQIMQMLGQINLGLKQAPKNQQIMELLKLIKSKVTIEAYLGDWKAQVIINIKDLTKLITQYKPQEYQEQDY